MPTATSAGTWRSVRPLTTRLGQAECLLCGHSGTFAQRLNLKRELHNTASKLRILGFETLKQFLIAGALPVKFPCLGIPRQQT